MMKTQPVRRIGCVFIIALTLFRVAVKAKPDLAAKSSGHADEWIPGVSGGNHMPEWPDEVQRFLRKVLHPYSGAKRYSYSFAACEVGRKFNLSIDRGQVRHWAIDHGLQADSVKPRPPAHVRRWQRKSIGELWQLDATPDRFVGRNGPVLQLLDMMDDCSRMQVGCSLFLHEHVPSYLSLFHKAFTKYGLPLEIYVDKARFFRNDDGSLTQLGKRLKFYDISFLFANSPEAKGKIERVHVVWQDRLPAYFEQEGIGMGSSFEELNSHVERLVEYRNNFEEHREIHMTPRKAFETGRAGARPYGQWLVGNGRQRGRETECCRFQPVSAELCEALKMPRPPGGRPLLVKPPQKHNGG